VNEQSVWVKLDVCFLGLSRTVSWKSRVIGFGHAELDIGDADTAEIA
jgi:hypothetical protein